MSTDEKNEHDMSSITHFDNQPKIIAFDVENEAIVGNDTGRAILHFTSLSVAQLAAETSLN
jgi:hypothetical protein